MCEGVTLSLSRLLSWKGAGVEAGGRRLGQGNLDLTMDLSFLKVIVGRPSEANF